MAELKRRKVTRVAVAYALAGVGVVEGADIIGTPLGLPEWVIPAFSLLVVIGFPIALVLAWALDALAFSPKGFSFLRKRGGQKGHARFPSKRQGVLP
jgi:hypothetical protein